METVLAVATVTLAPFAGVAALLAAAGALQRARAAVAARQVALTDAVHRDLGPVVSPWVARRPFGRWRVTITVPLDRPGFVAAVLDVVRGAFAEPFDIVLRPAASATRSGTAARARVSERRFPSWA
jgi:hypothetical protein